jgi:HEAT repeat protein/beta-lactamase regulating signal transducer with metallopeptidase domain
MTPFDLDATSAVILSWLLTYAIHSTILLGAAVVIAFRFAHEHAWLDLVWKTALLGPLVTASIQVGSDAIPLGGRWPIEIAAPIAVERAMPAAPRPHAASTPTTAVDAVPPQVSDRSRESAPTTSSNVASESVWQRVGRMWPAAAVLSWLAIAVVGLVRFGARVLGLHRRLGSGPPVSDVDLHRTVEALCDAANERRPVRLTTSAVCTVPLALTGRQIVLPERFLRQLGAEHQRAALAHEIAHVVRRDPAWRILVGFLERAFFFQPLNRVARAQLCDSAEFLCDQWAVQQTGSPLALARCLSIVASWASPASDRLAAGASTMARSDSPLVRRVTRILNDTQPVRRPSVVWFGLPLAVVAIAAPLVSAAQLTGPADSRIPANAVEATPPASPASSDASVQDEPSQRVWTATEIAQARARLRVYRSPRPTDPLAERWRWALSDAARQRIGDFWIVYRFDTPTHAQDLMMSDTREGSFVSSSGRLTTKAPPLADLLDDAGSTGGAGNVTVLMHYGGARADAVDRGGYRSTRLGFDFGRTPVFFLGSAPESESFARVEELFAQVRNEKIQVLLIELASIHPTTDIVIPFLTRLIDPSNSVAIRSEAAEGFNHHHDPRSVEILLRVARTDAVSEIRAEAAETIGEVQTPQSIPALTDLVTNSPDPAVRREGAEAFGDQPAELALPAIEQVLATSVHEEALLEAIEALGEIKDARVVALLVRTATGHSSPRAQQEAVETLGDVEAPDAVAALVRIVWEHTDATVQREAVETLGDRREPAAVTELERILRDHPVEDVRAEAIETLADVSDHRLNPVLLEQARSGSSARLRREALDAISHIASSTSDGETLDTAQRTIERAIFDDPDRAVRKAGIDALEGLPRDRALRVLRDVLERHADPDIREEARRGRR